MSITPRRQWHDLAGVRNEMFRNFLFGFMDNGPRFDIYYNDKEVIATIELPGLISKDDVEITATEDSLSVHGEIHRSEKAEKQSYHRTERFYGNFARTVTLPVKVQPEKATASYKNGILEIRLPTTERQRQRQVMIELH